MHNNQSEDAYASSVQVTLEYEIYCCVFTHAQIN